MLMCNLSSWRKRFLKTKDYNFSFDINDIVSPARYGGRGWSANFLNKPPTEIGPRTTRTNETNRAGQ